MWECEAAATERLSDVAVPPGFTMLGFDIEAKGDANANRARMMLMLHWFSKIAFN